MTVNDADYRSLNKMLKITQIIITVAVMILEFCLNILFCKIGTQGYTPENFGEKMIRYFLLTSLFDIAVVILFRIAIPIFKVPENKSNYLLIAPIILICLNVVFSHYQFAIVFAVFAIPLMISAFYEDKKFTMYTTVLSMVSLTPGAIARINDPLYCTDAIAEAVISYSFILVFAIIGYFIVDRLSKRSLMISEAIAESEDANRSKSDFLANMSHEIRTPMNAIVGMCELILRERDISETVQEYCYNIQNAGKNLLSIINDILDFSKIESGKMELIEDEFNIASTLNDVINMAVARKGDKKLEIIVRVDPTLPSGLIGDEVRIRQVIINLVTNAIKYSESGCISIKVSQTKQEYGINLSVSVKDTGIGITPENLEKLFSSFQQVDTKKNRSVEGTGLGLAISKRLITQMHGFINVESEYGKGSEFRFVIPLKVSNDAPFIHVKNAENIYAAGYINFEKFDNETTRAEYRTLIRKMAEGLHTRIDLFDTRDALKEALTSGDVKYTHVFTAREEYCVNEDFFTKLSETAEVILVQDRVDAIEVPKNLRCMFKPFYALSAAAVFNHESIVTNVNERRNMNIRFVAPQARVLIVDDNDINLKVSAGLMRPYLMQTVTANSASSAISLLRSKDFHIVFMDHMMPEVDGVEATKLIREMKDEYYQKLPIIALTANAVNGVKEMFIAAGMNDFIAKPIELSALDRVLRTYLPKELMKKPQASENYKNDKLKAAAPAISVSDDTLFSPQTGMFYTGGDEDAYLEILKMYVSKGAEKKEYIQQLFHQKDWKIYTIEVHALKSSSLSIGAKPLSEKAKELELAGKTGNFSLIEKKNSALLDMYDEVIKAGSEYLEKMSPKTEENVDSAEHGVTEVPYETVMEICSKIRTACENYDLSSVSELCLTAAGYSYNGVSLKELFDSVRTAVEDFEYEDAVKKITAIPDKLKGGV